MIKRYTLPEMGRVWSEAHKYELWCRVEVLVLEAHAEAGVVPADSVAPVRAAAPPMGADVRQSHVRPQATHASCCSPWTGAADGRLALVPALVMLATL